MDDHNITKTENEKIWYLEQLFPETPQTALLRLVRSSQSFDQAQQSVLREIKKMNSDDEAPVVKPQKKRMKRVRLMSESSDDMESPIKRSRVLSAESSQDTQDLPRSSGSFSRSTSNSQIDENILIISMESVLEEMERDGKQRENGDSEVIPLEAARNTTRRPSSKHELGADFKEVFDDDSHDEEDDVIVRSKSKRVRILHLFNTATDLELQRIPRCSSKKSDIIRSLRPFTDWADLCEKFQSHRQINTESIENCREFLDIRQVVIDLMERCQKMSNSMGPHVKKLHSSKISSLQISEQPSILNPKLRLKSYQMVGLNWLLLMYQNKVDGILADEMGLGKTAQSIAFLAYLYQHGNEGPHLIIVPSSTLDNWAAEIAQWCPALKVIIYHGKPEDRSVARYQIFNDPESYQIILSTYQVLTSSVEDKTVYKKLNLQYVVIDEAHMLKNMTTLRYKNLMKIRAERRLLLTGTPFQNDLVELMSLLCFVMPEMFINKEEQLKKMFTSISTKSKDATSFEVERIQNAKHIMKPFVLRRLKKDVLKELPKKFRHVEFIDLSSKQEKVYSELARNCLRTSKNVELQDECVVDMEYISKFRLCSSHHLLLRRYYNDERLRTMAKLILKEPTHRDAVEQYVFEDLQVLSDFQITKLCLEFSSLSRLALPESEIFNSSKVQYLDRRIPEIRAQGEKVLIFSQYQLVLDVLEKFLQIRNHSFLRLDGSTPVSERLDMIREFNSDPDIYVFLLTTRAGGLGINLTSANHVIIHDIDFNPHNDRQAEDRSHRLGQERDVHVNVLVTKRTVEEAMLLTANNKLELEMHIQDEKNEQKKEELKVLKETLMIWTKSHTVSTTDQ